VIAKRVRRKHVEAYWNVATSPDGHRWHAQTIDHAAPRSLSGTTASVDEAIKAAKAAKAQLITEATDA
jgi:hypothetical protein